MEFSDATIDRIITIFRDTPELKWIRSRQQAEQAKAKAPPTPAKVVPGEFGDFSPAVMADAITRYQRRRQAAGEHVSYDECRSAVLAAGPSSKVRYAAETRQEIENIESQQASLSAALDSFEDRYNTRLVEKIVKYQRDQQRDGKYFSYDQAKAAVSRRM